MAKQHLLKTLIVLALTLALMQCAQASHAQAAPPAITLAQIFPTAQPPAQGVALVVRAQQTILPGDSAAPPPGASLAECADAFDLTTHEFGTVIAVAPASMIVFNDNPDPPDLSEALTPSDAFKQLAATLSDSQWAKLTSAGGIGLVDLDSDQQTLWWAIFPGRSLKIEPLGAETSRGAPIEPTDLTSALPTVHIRLAQKVVIHGPFRAGLNLSFGVASVLHASAQWEVVPRHESPSDSQYGNLARADVSNSPKAGDLKFDQPALKAQVSLADVKTVGDLIFRIGQSAKIELYADRRCESWPVTLLGPNKTATASDLLQALEFCVVGTYRAVGPAYVLTDDLTGIAAIQQIWLNQEAKAQTIQARARDATQATLFARHHNETIPSYGDPLAQSPEEKALAQRDHTGRVLPWFASIDGVPFDKLTGAQQDDARRLIAQDPDKTAKVNSNWQIEPYIYAQLIAPGFSQPLAMPNIAASSLLYPPTDEVNEFEQTLFKAQMARQAAASSPPPSLAATFKLTSHRAVLAAPRSASEVKALVATMRKIGLNELWLMVFFNGQARIPGTSFPQPLGEKDDMLADALAATKGTGITVFPAADLLAWGTAPPDTVRDMNVLGENSIQDAAGPIAALTAVSNPFETERPAPDMWVSPIAPEVRSSLPELTSALAKHPEIGGLVWRDIMPPGYNGAYESDTLSGMSYSSDSHGNPVVRFPGRLNLGYTMLARLAFLRAFHADPIDIRGEISTHVDLDISPWDDGGANSKQTSEWDKFRHDAADRLLRSLLQTAQMTAPKGKLMPIFQLVRGAYYGGPRPPGPWPANGDLPEPRRPLTLAVHPLEPTDTPDNMSQWLTVAAKQCDGFVLDLLPADGGAGVAGLENLAGTVGDAQGVTPDKDEPSKTMD